MSRPGIVDADACPTSPARVAVVEPVGGHGGMEFWNHALCAALVAAGWPPLLLTSQAMRDDAATYDAWEVYRGVFGNAPKWRRGLRYIRATLNGLRHARRLGAQVAHFHVFHVGLLQYFGVVLARLSGFRVVLSAHDVGSFRAGESSRLLSRIYAASHAIIVYSERGKRTLLDSFGVPESKAFVVPLGNYEGFLPPLPASASAKASFGYEIGDFVLLFFGQIKQVKRLDLLLRALANARRRGGDRLRLLVAGGAADTDMATINRLIAEERLEDVVQMHVRYIDNDDLPRHFAAADLVVLPYDNIYQSGVVLLAMSNDVPVLTSDIPGMLEVIEHECTGLTFRAGDVDALADRLLAAAAGRWDLTALRSEARRVVATRHSWQNCAAITVDAYQAAAGRLADVGAQ